MSDGLFSQGEPLEERRVHYPFLQEAVNADLEEYIQAIMEDPAVILLDEPMNGLDNQGVEDIRRAKLFCWPATARRISPFFVIPSLRWKRVMQKEWIENKKS